MFILAEIVKGLSLLVSLGFNIIYIILVVRIIISWTGADPHNEIVQVVCRITDPILEPLRRLPLQFGGIDFSPVIAFLLLSVLNSVISSILFRIAMKLA